MIKVSKWSDHRLEKDGKALRKQQWEGMSETLPEECGGFRTQIHVQRNGESAPRGKVMAIAVSDSET